MPSSAPVVCFPTSGTHHPAAFALLLNCARVLSDWEVRVLDGKKRKANKTGTEINHPDRDRTIHNLGPAQHLRVRMCVFCKSWVQS